MIFVQVHLVPMGNQFTFIFIFQLVCVQNEENKQKKHKQGTTTRQQLQVLADVHKSPVEETHVEETPVSPIVIVPNPEICRFKSNSNECSKISEHI